MPTTSFLRPRSGLRPIIGRENVHLVSQISLSAAIEFAMAEGTLKSKVDCESCLCKKCSKSIDPTEECRFFERRGGRDDGLRMVGHRRCVSLGITIEVSPESALQIFLRQRSPVRR